MSIKQHKLVGFYGFIAPPVPNAPNSECPQLGMPQSFDRCVPPVQSEYPAERRAAAAVPLLNRHVANFKIYLLHQFCSNRVNFFYITQETQTQK